MRAKVLVRCGAVVLLAAASMGPLAVLNKAAPNRCDGKPCANLVEIAKVVLSHPGGFLGGDPSASVGGAWSSVMKVLGALMAAFFLGALACLVAGALKMANGAPGGGQIMLGGLFGIVVFIVCTGVVL